MTTPADMNLGPLTTTFTAPTDCNSITVAVTGSSTYLPYVYPRLFSSIATSCFPSGYPLGNAALTSIFGLYDYQDWHVYYSPGICPSGWLKNIVGVSNAETTAFCCEPGFNPQTPAVLGGTSSTFCASSIDSTVITTVAYTGDGETSGFTRTFTFTGDMIPAPAIWIRYKNDFSLSDTTTTSSAAPSSSSSSSPSSTSAFISASASSASPASSTTQTSSVNNPSSTSNSPAQTSPLAPASNISTGAKIGIGVGVPLAVIIALVAFAFIFIRRRKQRRVTELAGNEVGGSGSDVKSGWVPIRSELPVRNVSRNRVSGRSELDSGGSPSLPLSELEAGVTRDQHGG